MEIRIAERQPVQVACFRYTGPLGAPLGRFWRTTVNPWLGEHGLLDCPRYGVTLDNPMITPPETCRYDACVELPRGLTLPGREMATIPGGSFAIATFKGTSAQVGEGWNYLVGAALAGARFRVDAQRHPFEHYPRGAGYDARTGVFWCELCLPVYS